MDDIRSTIHAWLVAHKKVALATVVQTWGSSPRQVGAKMGITADLEIVGSVSGGCVETAVIQAAEDVLLTEQPQLLHFGVSDDTAWSVGLACGGEIDVFVEPLDEMWWATFHAQADTHLTTITVLDGSRLGQKMLLRDGKVLYASAGLATPSGQPTFLNHVSSQSMRLTTPEWDVLIDVHEPYPQIVMVGGGHVAIHLQHLATEMGFRVLLIDPRRTFANPERFPQASQIFTEYPNQAFPKITWTAQTYLVVLSHDPKIDDPALEVALQQNLPYVGVMSSRTTHQKRITRLQERGLTDAQIAKIRTPIGLNLQAQNPAEIALSIMAEIVAVRNAAELGKR